MGNIILNYNGNRLVMKPSEILIRPDIILTGWTFSSLPEQFWRAIDCSEDAKHVYVGSNTNIYKSSDYGVTWSDILTNSIASDCVKCSRDGRYVVAGITSDHLKTSNDYGVTWIERTGSTSKTWRGVHISNDGNFIYGATSTGKIECSYNGGSTWVEKTVSATPLYSLTGSIDGKTLFTVDSDQTFLSLDSGTTWTNTTLYANLNATCSSYDGTKLACSSNDIAGKIYVNITGLTWSGLTNSYLDPSLIVNNMCSSYDGNVLAYSPYHLVATPEYGKDPLRRSIDRGQNWETINIVKYWSGICSDKYGKRFYAIYGVDTYTTPILSTDGGMYIGIYN